MPTRRTFLSTAAGAIAAATRLAPAIAEKAPIDSKSSMKTYRIPQTDLTVSRLAYGPANLSGWDHGPLTSEVIAKTAGVIQTAFDQGINFLDLADMEGFGKVEQVVGEVLKQSSGLRAKLVLQTKCGMRFREGAGFDGFQSMDLTREHIVSAAEGSLRRLGTDQAPPWRPE